MFAALQRKAGAFLGRAAAVTTFALAAAIAPAQPAQPALIPADSAYVFSIPDTGAFWSALEKNAGYQAIQKALETGDFAEGFRSAQAELKTIEEALGFKLDGPTLTSIMTSADIYVRPGKNAGEVAALGIISIADREKFEKILTLAEESAAEAAASSDDDSEEGDDESTGTETTEGGGDNEEAEEAASPIKSEEFEGVTIKTVTDADDDKVIYALGENHFFMSNNIEEIKAGIQRAQGSGKGATLDEDARIKSAVAGLPAGPTHVFVYTDARQSMELQKGDAQMAGLQKILTNYIPDVPSAIKIVIEPKAIAGTSFTPVDDKAKQNPLIKMHLSQPDGPLDVLGFAPESTLLTFAATGMDVEVLVGMVKEIFTAAMDGVGDASEITSQIKAAEEQLGFSFDKDLIPAIGSDLGLFVNSVVMKGFLPEIDAAIVFGVKDKAKMESVLAKLEAFGNAAAAGAGVAAGEKLFGEETIEGEKARVANTPLPGVSPSIVLTDKYLIISTTKEAMTAALKNKAGTGTALANSAVFKGLAPRITANAQSVSFLDFGEILKTVQSVIDSTGDSSSEVKDIISRLGVIKAIASANTSNDKGIIQENVIQFE